MFTCTCLCPLHLLWPRPDIQPSAGQPSSRVFQGLLMSCLLSAVTSVGLSENSVRRVLVALLSSSSQPQLMLWVLRILGSPDKLLPCLPNWSYALCFLPGTGNRKGQGSSWGGQGEKAAGGPGAGDHSCAGPNAGQLPGACEGGAAAAGQGGQRFQGHSWGAREGWSDPQKAIDNV